MNTMSGWILRFATRAKLTALPMAQYRLWPNPSLCNHSNTKAPNLAPQIKHKGPKTRPNRQPNGSKLLEGSEQELLRRWTPQLQR